jgi:hypothetical protein
LKFSILIFLFAAIFQINQVWCQNQDSLPESKKNHEIYFEDYTDHLALRLYTLTKFSSLNIRKDPELLRLLPNGQTNLGVGFHYKFIGIGISFGLPVSKSRIDKYGKTTRFDLQFSTYSKWLGADGYIQGYRGYYLDNPQDFMDWNEENKPKVPDMRIFSLGGSAFYIFNKDKFSYKAAYLRTQVQKKSAGSAVLGIFAHYDAAKTDNGFVPTELPDSIRSDIDLSQFDVVSGGISAGYMHTFVIRGNFSFNFSLIPGFGIQKIAIQRLDGTGGIQTQPAAQLIARGALGYDFKKVYLGINASAIFRNFKYKEYNFDLGTEQIRFFIGKRFDVRKK